MAAQAPQYNYPEMVNVPSHFINKNSSMGGSMGSDHGEGRISDQYHNDYVDTRVHDENAQQNVSDIYSEPKIMSGKSDNHQ